MSFDYTIYGNFGDEKVSFATKPGALPLGARMELPDGRIFRLSQLGAAAAVAGCLYQGVSAANANTIFAGGAKSLVPNAAAIGATSVNVTCAGTTFPASSAAILVDGYLVTSSSVGAGIGYNYKVKSISAGSAATSTLTVTLYENDAVKVALEAGTTKVQIIPSPYQGALLTTADTVGVSTVLGVACATAAASTFVWLQRRGNALAYTDATNPIVGTPVTCSTTVAGAIGAWPTSAADTAGVRTGKGAGVLGYAVLGCGTTTQFTPIDLTIE
jgi:hypothetical protein